MENEVLKKRNRNKKIIIFVSGFVVVALIALSIFLIWNYYHNINKVEYETKEYELYQYFTGIKESYTGKVTLIRNGNITNIKTGDEEIEANSIPMYFTDDDTKAILPDNMSITFTRERTNKYKTVYFTELESESTDSGTNIYLKKNGKSVPLANSVLYDGEDLYFFPYETTVTIDDEVYELSALSYVIACGKDQIEIYNRKEDKYTILENIKDDAIATFDKTKINLSSDMVIFDNDKTILLLHNVDSLKSYN